MCVWCLPVWLCERVRAPTNQPTTFLILLLLSFERRSTIKTYSVEHHPHSPCQIATSHQNALSSLLYAFDRKYVWEGRTRRQTKHTHTCCVLFKANRQRQKGTLWTRWQLDWMAKQVVGIDISSLPSFTMKTQCARLHSTHLRRIKYRSRCLYDVAMCDVFSTYGWAVSLCIQE